jgi:hypothetical protein
MAAGEQASFVSCAFVSPMTASVKVLQGALSAHVSMIQITGVSQWWWSAFLMGSVPQRCLTPSGHFQLQLSNAKRARKP